MTATLASRSHYRCSQQNHHASQTQMQEEDETVDVESYGEETSNGAINMTSQMYHNNNNSSNVVNNNTNSNQVINNNNNNNTIMHSKIDKTTPEDHHTIATLNRTAATTNWDHKSRMSLNLNCAQMSDNAITRVTPTSSDQRIDVEYELDNERDQSQERMSDNEEELIVDNTDDEGDCNSIKRKAAQLQSSAPRLISNGLREMKKR
jgi:hypothetical protein